MKRMRYVRRIGKYPANVQRIPSNLYSSDEKKFISIQEPSMHKTYQRSKDQNHSLTNVLKQKISGSGPMSVAHFMRDCLLDPELGYYSTKENVIQKDFITSPEISSVFGECCAFWIYHQWLRLGSPKQICMVEIGPGLGTLMNDVLRTLERLKFPATLRVILIEKGEEMRKRQKEKLVKKKLFDSTTGEVKRESGFCGAKLEWYDDLEHFEPVNGEPLLFLAHEFFDALPVIQCKKTERGFLELLVDINEEKTKENPYDFKFVLSHRPTPNSYFATRREKMMKQELPIGSYIEVCPKAMSVMEQLGFLIDEYGGSILIFDYAFRGDQFNSNSLNDQISTIDRMSTTSTPSPEILKNLPSSIPSHSKDTAESVLSLQGIRGHTFVHPFEEPGNVDLSTYVDYEALIQSLRPFENISCVIMDQREFLWELGIDARLLQQLMKRKSFPKEQDRLIQAYERLTLASEMGIRYKVLSCMAKKKD